MLPESEVALAQDLNCSDFNSQAEAQDDLWSTAPNDPNNLDRDNDGIACDTTPYPDPEEDLNPVPGRGDNTGDPGDNIGDPVVERTLMSAGGNLPLPDQPASSSVVRPQLPVSLVLVGSGILAFIAWRLTRSWWQRLFRA